MKIEILYPEICTLYGDKGNKQYYPEMSAGCRISGQQDLMRSHSSSKRI